MWVDATYSFRVFVDLVGIVSIWSSRVDDVAGDQVEVEPGVVEWALILA